MTFDNKFKLEEEMKKYQSKLEQMQKDWAASKGGSRYGDEYLETQIKVYQDMIGSIKNELALLKKKKNG